VRILCPKCRRAGSLVQKRPHRRVTYWYAEHQSPPKSCYISRVDDLPLDAFRVLPPSPLRLDVARKYSEGRAAEWLDVAGYPYLFASEVARRLRSDEPLPPWFPPERTDQVRQLVSQPGCPDLFVSNGEELFAAEVKDGASRLRPHQVAALRRAEELGFKPLVINTKFYVSGLADLPPAPPPKKRWFRRLF
jgi:hypothetical protein